MAKEIVAHSDFRRVTVIVNNIPISVNAEVDIILRQPTKLDQPSRVGWSSIWRDGTQAVTAELIPVEVDPLQPKKK